jgi:hypothetical protein
LDRIDFSAYASGADSPYKLLYLKVISDAASDYLFFGLGNNGTVPDDFWYATEYFFSCRSFRPETWEHARFMRKAYFDEALKKRVSTSIMLTDEELKQACFDRHYEITELDTLMPFEDFVVALRETRAELLRKNWEQANTYIDLIRQASLKKVANNTQTALPLQAADRMQVLVSPESPEQVAELTCYIPRCRVTARCAPKLNVPSLRTTTPRSRAAWQPTADPMQTQFALQ